MSIRMDETMTVAEAARNIGITERRVRQLIDSGEIEGTLITPRLWLVTKKSVETFMRKSPPKLGRPRKSLRAN